MRWRPLILMPTLPLRDARPDHQENDDHFLVEEARPCGEEEEGNGTQGEFRGPSSPSLSLPLQAVGRAPSLSPGSKPDFDAGF